MRLLILSFYYRPDLSAGAFRATALVDKLFEQVPSGTQIDVITTLPNRYRTFECDASELEVQDGLTIRRIALPVHSSDMLGQSRAFLLFVKRAQDHIAGHRYDLVFATSSRLMTAALGAWIARRQRAPLYLDIRDIFSDTIGDVLPWPAAWFALRVFSALESWTMRRADRINLVSRGFEDHFRTRYPDKALSWFTNGIDDEFIEGPTARVSRKSPQGRSIVLYAGNIGEGQGLHEIIPDLARALRHRIRFVVIGDGGRRCTLEAALEHGHVDNVELRAPMPRMELLDAYRAADVLFLHLGTHRAFEHVLPSKVFEYAALGKPVLAGVGGYAARFIREEVANSAVFRPCNVTEAVMAFASLELVDRPRPKFVAKYARANIARAMARDVLALVERQ